MAGEAVTDVGDDVPQTLGNACQDPKDDEGERDLRDRPYALKKRRTLIPFVGLICGKITHAMILATSSADSGECPRLKSEFRRLAASSAKPVRQFAWRFDRSVIATD